MNARRRELGIFYIDAGFVAYFAIGVIYLEVANVEPIIGASDVFGNGWRAVFRNVNWADRIKKQQGLVFTDVCGAVETAILTALGCTKNGCPLGLHKRPFVLSQPGFDDFKEPGHFTLPDLLLIIE